METLRVSTKGQIVIPKEIRERRQWVPGTALVVEEHGDAVVLRAVKPFPPTKLQDGLGCAGYHGPEKSLSEMEEAVSHAIEDEWKASR
jgi:AbrB family looped-hinge helix DNA binding protein